MELPPQYAGLQYCAILCGVIRGAFEVLQKRVAARIVRDPLRGDGGHTEIRVDLVEVMRDTMDDDYKEG